MSAHLFVLLLFLVAALVVAVPRITSRRAVPRELVFEQVPDSALTDAQLAHFSRLDATLQALQYRPVFNIRVANLAGNNLSRFYTCATDPALILTSLLRVRVQGGSGHNLDYLEIITRYQDGTELTTSNNPTASPFDRVPQRVIQRLGGFDAPRLKERHDRAAAALLPRGPLWVRDHEILTRWQESHRRWCEHQVQQGLLAYDGTSDRFGPTRRTAFRGIASYVNPVAGVTPLRLLAGVLLSALLLGTGILVVQAPASPLMAELQAVTHLSGRVLGPLVVYALFTLAGVVVGLTFGQRHFVWALILGVIPVAVMGDSSGAEPLAAVVWLGLVARSVARWQNRRRRLL